MVTIIVAIILLVTVLILSGKSASKQIKNTSKEKTPLPVDTSTGSNPAEQKEGGSKTVSATKKVKIQK